MEQIKDLCSQYTDLKEKDVLMIEGVAAVLQLLANLEEADVFIDCPTTDGEAIVVAEAKPQDAPSSYKKTVVGLLAKAENEPAVARTFSLGTATKRMKALTQEKTHVIQSVEPIYNEKHVIGVLILEKHTGDAVGTLSKDEGGFEKNFKLVSYDSAKEDMPAHCNIERESMTRCITNYEAVAQIIKNSGWLLEGIGEALLLVDYNGIVSFVNSLAKELYVRLGFIDDILGKKYDDVRLAVGDFNSNANSLSAETKVGPFSLVIKKIQINLYGIAFAVLIRNVTFIREQEKQLVLKNVAIKEIHHRVKNNLQTIASLLRLQARRAKNCYAKQYLEESMNRILAIAVTHDLLAQSGVDEVMIGKVIANIKGNAIRYFSRPYCNVTIDISGDDFEVTSDNAASIALVLNELLQNSLKYAFNGRGNGKIAILVEGGDLYSKITVTDDGCGFDTNAASGDSLGLKIVQTIVEDKLHGKLTVNSGPNGTSTAFDFKN